MKIKWDYTSKTITLEGEANVKEFFEEIQKHEGWQEWKLKIEQETSILPVIERTSKGCRRGGFPYENLFSQDPLWTIPNYR